MPRRFPSYCAPTREKCTLIFRNNADERRIFTDRRTKEMYREIFPAVLLDTCILHWLRRSYPLRKPLEAARFIIEVQLRRCRYQTARIFTHLRAFMMHKSDARTRKILQCPFLDIIRLPARQILCT